MALHHNAGNTFTTSKLCVDILYRRNTANQKYQRDWVNPKSCELSGCVKVAFVKGVYISLCKRTLTLTKVGIEWSKTE